MNVSQRRRHGVASRTLLVSSDAFMNLQDVINISLGDGHRAHGKPLGDQPRRHDDVVLLAES